MKTLLLSIILIFSLIIVGLPQLPHGYSLSWQNFQTFPITWNQKQYNILTWANNTSVTNVKVPSDGKIIHVDIYPTNGSLLKIQIPRDLFEESWVGLDNVKIYAINLAPLGISEIEPGCDYRTFEVVIPADVHEITFDDSWDYYRGPGGPITHTLAGTFFSNIGFPSISVESEQRICQYSFKVVNSLQYENIFLRVNPSSEPNFMQLQFQNSIFEFNPVVYANNQPIPYNQSPLGTDSASLSFTYPPNTSQINITSTKPIDNLINYSPKKQAMLGISAFDIICKSGFEKLAKSTDATVICVYPVHAAKLIKLGVATVPSWLPTYSQPPCGNCMPSGQADYPFEAGGVIFDVTGAKIDLSHENDTKQGGVGIIVNMTAQSIRGKVVHFDSGYFTIWGNKVRTSTDLSNVENYTRYTVYPDHPTNIQFFIFTGMDKNEFGLYNYSIAFNLQSQLVNPLVPLKNISCLSHDSSAC